MMGTRHTGRVCLHGWLSTKAEVQKDLQSYWSFRDEIVIIDEISMKGRRIIVPASLQNKILDKMQLNNMDIEKK